jgi:hypothetical protein
MQPGATFKFRYTVTEADTAAAIDLSRLLEGASARG